MVVAPRCVRVTSMSCASRATLYPRSAVDYRYATHHLEDVIDYLAGLDGRITVVHLGENSARASFSSADSAPSTLAIFTVLERQDIPKIVLGQVRHYLSGLPTPR